MHKLDLTELQDQVIDKWEDGLVDYFTLEHNGDSHELFILPEFHAILNDPIRLLNELGYTKISSYIAERRACN